MAEYFEMQNEDTSIISYDISVIPNDFNVMTINSLIESGINARFSKKLCLGSKACVEIHRIFDTGPSGSADFPLSNGPE